MRQQFPIAATLGCLALGLAGCNSDNSTGSTSTTANATLAGLWGGTDADDSGATLSVLISSTNQMVAIRSDGAVFTGLLNISGDTIAAAIDGYANYGEAFSDSSTYGIGTLDATIVPSTSITATVDFTTSGNTSLPGSWSLTPGSLTSIGSSLTAVAGTFTNTVTGGTITISSAGTMSGTADPTTGCTLTGNISTNDASIDVYEVSYALANCTGSYAALNGVAFTGLGYANNSASPLTLTYAVSGSASSTANYGIVTTLSGATT